MSTSDICAVRTCQMEVRQGDVAANTNAILCQLEAARAAGARLVVFPELALSGHLEAPEWLSGSLLRSCEAAWRQITAATHSMAVILGAAVSYRGRMVNAAVAAENGVAMKPEHSPLDFVPKLLSTSNRLDAIGGYCCATNLTSLEGSTLTEFYAPFNFKCGKVGVWLGKWEAGIADHLAGRGAVLLVQLANTPYTRNQPEYGLNQAEVEGVGVPLIRCGATGLVDTGKTLFALSGNSGFALPGVGIKQAPRFAEAVVDSLSVNNAEQANHESATVVIEALERACAWQLTRLGLKRVVIGASGGIDSALAAAIYSRVVAPENLLLINMPSRYTSPTTLGLARQLARNLGCFYTEIDIEESVRLTARQIDELGEMTLPGSQKKIELHLTEMMLENVQARDRSARVLAAVGSAFNGVYTCNSNKSECMVGYATLYGDLAGFFAVLADLWKTEVWEIAHCYNQRVFGREIIPAGSIELVPSAELSGSQDVERGRGDPWVYEWHDKVFAAWTEREPRAELADLLQWHREGRLAQELGFTGELDTLFPTAELLCQDLERAWRLSHGLARAKRLQAPPILSLKNRTFGFDMAMAQNPSTA